MTMVEAAEHKQQQEMFRAQMDIARDVKDVPSVVTEWESPFYWIH